MGTSDQILKNFGARIREIRKSKGLSQEEFSFACDLDRTYVSQVEQGRRNISLQNIKAMADALEVSVADLFASSTRIATVSRNVEPVYRVNEEFLIECGFEVTAQDILASAISTAGQLQILPFSLYKSIDLKTLSSIVGTIFVGFVADRVGAIVNPIEKGHPDIIPTTGLSATESQLRNYPYGLEIKSTVGNVRTGSNLEPGTPRIEQLTAVTWQAHHKEVNCLMGLIIDFAGETQGSNRFPIITGVFFADDLTEDDWGEISGTTGRNTKVCGMRSSGKNKMGRNWVLLLNHQDYLDKYGRLFDLSID